MSEETLKIVVPVFTAVLGLFVGYFLNQALYERKRRDELADREFGRRAVVHDRRIHDAREYVDKWESLLFIVNEINSKVLQATNVDDMQRVLHLENYNKSHLLLEGLSKQVSVLNILNDDELLDWHKKFLPKLFPLIKYLLERIKIIVQINHFDIDKNRLMTLSQRCTSSVVVFARMKYKLDELEISLK